MTKKAKIKAARKKRIARLVLSHGNDILSHQTFKGCAKNIQHGNISVYDHSLNVASTALAIARGLKLRVRERDMVRGALLHDYFLYDWHKDGKDKGNVHPRLHGFYHPGTALRNAERDFTLTERERDIIKKHMWPLTIIPPICTESWIVTVADKATSLMETLGISESGS